MNKMPDLAAIIFITMYQAFCFTSDSNYGYTSHSFLKAIGQSSFVCKHTPSYQAGTRKDRYSTFHALES